MTLLVIAHNTFREGIRAKVLYNLVFFAVLLILFSYFLGQLSIGANVKVMMDVGLFSISFMGVLIAIFVGIGLVYKELEKRTIFTIVSKPIHRSQFIVGKYLGLCLTLFVQLLVMWLFFMLLLYVYSGKFHWQLTPAGLFIYLELMVITAFAILFSSFSTPFLSALFTLSFYLVGHTTTELFEVGKKTENVIVINLLDTLHRFLNLDHFNLMTEVVHGLPVTASRMANGIAYGLSAVILILILSCLIFQKRDFK